MDSIEQESIYICARLMRQGYVRKDEFRNLEINDRLLQQVQYRLAQVGMKLIINTYSPYYAVRLFPEIQENLDESNSLGLKSNEVAMLVILWCKLILPKRLAIESKESTTEAKNRQKNQLQEEQKNTTIPTESKDNTVEDSPKDRPKDSPVETEPAPPHKQKQSADVLEDGGEITKYYIKFNELWAEFGERFGNKTIFKATLTRLNNLQFIRVRDEIISEGILLDLLIDGHQMAGEVKRSALAYKLAGLEDEENLAEVDEEELENEK